MKRQKHYDTRKQILTAIDAAHQQLAETIAAANAEDAAAKRDAKAAAASKNGADRAHLEEQARYHIKERQRLFKAAYRIEQVKIPKLGRTLAAFDTRPMEVEGLNSETVVLAK